MPEFKIIPSKTAFLIIDMTNAFLKETGPIWIPGGIGIISNLNKLRSIARSKSILTIFTTHAYHKDGSDLGIDAVFRPKMRTNNTLRIGTPDIEFYADIQPDQDDIVIMKSRYNAFIGTELDLILRSHEIDTLIIGGVATNICCESTAREARMRDYKVIFLSDGTASRDIPDLGFGKISAFDVQRYTLATVACFFGQVSSVNQVINQITNSDENFL